MENADTPPSTRGAAEGHRQPAVQGAEVDSVASIVRLPPFWEEDPALWFIQVEAVFSAHRITAAGHRFNLVVSQLPYKILSQAADLARDPGSTPYESIKHRLINAFSQSQERRVLKLLEETQLGDSRPSQLLRHMQTASDGSLSEQVLKTVWLRALPNRIKNILTALDQPLSQLAIIADKILDNDPSDVAAVTPKEDALTLLIAEVKELRKALDDHRNRSRSQVQDRAPRRERSKSRNRTRKEDWLCYYHFKFKDKARKCEQPCNWTQRSSLNK